MVNTFQTIYKKASVIISYSYNEFDFVTDAFLNMTADDVLLNSTLSIVTISFLKENKNELIRLASNFHHNCVKTNE